MPNPLSDERVAELLEAEAKVKKMKATQRKAWQRRNARINIMTRKATEAGITVSEKELQAELSKKK